MPEKKRFLSVSIALLSASVLFAPVDAGAQNLFERLFGGNRINQRERMPEPPPPPAKPIVRISSPSYYKYTTDSLKPVDLAAIVKAVTENWQSPRFGDIGFGEALVSLGGIELLAEADIAAALEEHYSQHPDFIWVDGAKPNRRAIEAVRVLGEADRFGLEPADYLVAMPSAATAGKEASGRHAELMRFEMALSARVLRYVSDARNGRVVADRLSGYHDLPRKAIDLAGVLNNLGHTQEVRTYLETRHPQNDEYMALRRELELLRASAENEIVIEAGTLIKPGQTNPEFAKVLQLIEQKSDDAFRAEYGPLLAASSGAEIYSEDLVPLVKAAQKAHRLGADGIIGPRTIAALAGETRAARIRKVVLSLERLRWLPSDLGDPHVFINQASFMVTYTEGGEDRLAMRAVVGTRANQTSFFYDKIEQVDFNPYWGVPQSILVNEMLPKLRRDPGYLDRSGYEVTTVSGQRISSSAVDWNQYGGKVPFDVRQKPGANNALGELKILFPNKHAIYMHDTPAKNLFEKDVRAYSHGCVRLADPRGMAAAVLGWSRDQIAERLRQGHSTEKVIADIPVYVGYFTAWRDSDGNIGFHDDVYGRDDRLQQAMEMTSDSRQGSG